MAEVRSSAGVPLAAAFGGLGAPSPGTPLIVDTVGGGVYALLGGVVTLVSGGGGGGAAWGSITGTLSDQTDLQSALDAKQDEIATGTATLNFGATPGTNVATVTVTGQTGIAAGSAVRAWIGGASTATHNAYEHLIVPLIVKAGDIVAGTGFTIYASSDLRLDGTFTCNWSWS